MSTNISDVLLRIPGVELQLRVDLSLVGKPLRNRMVRSLRKGHCEYGQAGMLLRQLFPGIHKSLPFRINSGQAWFPAALSGDPRQRAEALLTAATVGGHHTKSSFRKYHHILGVNCPQSLSHKMLTMEHDEQWMAKVEPYIERIERGDTIVVNPC